MEDSTVSMGDTRKILRRVLVPVLMILFIFLAPIVPITVSQNGLLPWVNECHGGLVPYGYQEPTVSVYASISYAVVQGILELTSNAHQGFFGLVIVPNIGGDTVQFPPLGFVGVNVYESRRRLVSARCRPLYIETQGVDR